MPAYYSGTVGDYLSADQKHIVDQLASTQLNVTPQQKRAWTEQLTVLRAAFDKARATDPTSARWGVVIEYPMFRLGRRLDVVVLVRDAVCVLEFKVGAADADAASRKQVEDYALDLRDFHEPSRQRRIFPVVCPTELTGAGFGAFEFKEDVASVLVVAPQGLCEFFLRVNREANSAPQTDLEEWEGGAYKPVPTIIEAASMLYLTHSVEEIRSALSSQPNLNETIDRLHEIREWVKANRRHAVCFVTGVPGSGKTLVGLNLVHDPRFDEGAEGSTAFLSGNSPLVEVLREALARDAARAKNSSVTDERRRVRSRIQHLMNYLKQYLDQEPGRPPHEHVVVFDEAQRAWDEKFGKRKFGRTASEPYLFLDILARHTDWALIVALVGGGQEINTGEHGLSEWGIALQRFNEKADAPARWMVFAAEDVVSGKARYGGTALWADAPASVETMARQDLHLSVSVRSHRNERINEWVAALLDGRQLDARRLADEAQTAPIYVTRSLESARRWARESRGNRRFGLLATSGARRLRGYGLGVSLSVMDIDSIVHWFLAASEDVRSSYALEVTATEFACQGLELDRVVVCWDHDMTWDSRAGQWTFRSFVGNKWTVAKTEEKRRYVANSYRVLMTRARESLVVWVPPGDASDPTRPPPEVDATYRYLMSCGIKPLEYAADEIRIPEMSR